MGEATACRTGETAATGSGQCGAWPQIARQLDQPKIVRACLTEAPDVIVPDGVDDE